jgi:hypothetical protein
MKLVTWNVNALVRPVARSAATMTSVPLPPIAQQRLEDVAAHAFAIPKYHFPSYY